MPRPYVMIEAKDFSPLPDAHRGALFVKQGGRTHRPYANNSVKEMSCIRYIHGALWVSKVVLNELDGWFHFKRPVGSLCIVS